MLSHLVNPVQSAFIENRVILHNIFLYHDILKHYKRKNQPARCTVKFDLKKAYDSLNWEFIKELLVGMNFPQQFVNWIMVCITTPSFPLSFNGGLCGFFQGKKGLRRRESNFPLAICSCYGIFR